jgi:hypothetical protein
MSRNISRWWPKSERRATSRTGAPSMSIHDKIAKLPKHAEPRLIPEARINPVATYTPYWEHEAHCYRAELALAREWIESQPHGLNPSGLDCGRFASPMRGCNCGRYALLAAITPPSP